MSEHTTDPWLSVSREALHGTGRMHHEQQLLDGLMTRSPEESASNPSNRKDTLEVSVPDALLDQAEEVRVLHVDDNPEFGAVTRTFLEREREALTVVTAENAVEGLTCLRNEHFDCVVSDYEMPTTDGLELLELVREEFPDVPFILFTGTGDEALASEAIAAGVTDYVRKQGGSRQYEILANRIDNAVERYRTQQQFWDALSMYQRFVEQDLVGVCVVQNGEFVYANGYLADLLDRDRDALLGSHPRTILCECGVELDELFEQERTFHRDCAVERADGETVPVEIHGGPVQCGGDPGCLAIFCDR